MNVRLSANALEHDLAQGLGLGRVLGKLQVVLGQPRLLAGGDAAVDPGGRPQAPRGSVAPARALSTLAI